MLLLVAFRKHRELPRNSQGGRMGTMAASYTVVGVVFAAFVAVLVSVVRTTSTVTDSAQAATAALIQPVVALVILTGIVSVLMVIFRNFALIRLNTTVRYFQTYDRDKPSEWVERPTRTYMNLLELPILFYVVCALMLDTGRFDYAQTSLAWLFVMTRYVHAIVYIGFNYVPLRFASFLAGFVTLAVMWARFAEQNLA
jgi:hypothetical protein